jgi:hypothetical protein
MDKQHHEQGHSTNWTKRWRMSTIQETIPAPERANKMSKFLFLQCSLLLTLAGGLGAEQTRYGASES